MSESLSIAINRTGSKLSSKIPTEAFLITVNGLRIDGGNTGSGVAIASQGSDADVNLVLAAQGNGRVTTSKQLMWRPLQRPSYYRICVLAKID